MWEQIRANRRRSAVLITGMAIVLLLLGGLAGSALFGPDGAVIGIGIALILWGVQLAVYATNAESVLLHGTFAKELDRNDSPQLFNVVDEMKLASGLPFTPRIFLIDDPSPNAFAIGSKPENAAIAVTTGLLHRLNRDELQGVIAHEIGHLKNRDVQFMTLAAVMLGSIVILSQIVLRTMQFGGRGRSRSESRGGGQAQLILLLVALLFAILGPVMAQLLYFACSRKREFLADASGAQFTRYPEGLASALEKISQAEIPATFANKTNAALCIVNPLALTRESSNIFSSHPPTAERIRILRAMAGASLAAYEEAYRRAQGTGLIGAQSLRDDQPQPIRPATPALSGAGVAGPVEERRQVRDLSHRMNGYLRLRCTCGLEIKVPPDYERNEIRCVRCGSVLPVS
jgi:heat shock protein HtpX